MKFNVEQFHSIFESGNIDDGLVCIDEAKPISKDVFLAMKEAAANPANIKVTLLQKKKKSDIFIEAMEFSTYCDARDIGIKEAVDEIMAAHAEEIENPQNTKVHMVFPTKSLIKHTLGSQNFGTAVKNDWAMKLIRGCQHYGLDINYSCNG